VTCVRVWAPEVRRVELECAGRRRPMAREADGWWSVEAPELVHGTDYAFRLDGEGPFPDPRSPWQPHGVHGPSRWLDHGRFRWHDAGWQAPPLASAVIHELHVGTFTPEGTFEAVIDRLDHLKDLGITHVELMPVAEFPGKRGWGYDGVDLFAPHHAYGGPEGLKRLVDACHRKGLAVLLDVVYNHLGPSGNYLGRFGPYFTDAYRTPWGDAVNLDRAHSDTVRRFFLDNALMWLEDYHFDGLRDPTRYFHRLHAACPDAWVVAEKILEPGESLPADWPVAGTTGYDFLNRVQGLFVDPAGEAPLTRLLEELTGEAADFAELVHDCKREVVKELLGSELNRLVSLFVEVCERHRRHRDYTRHELYQALLEVAACFPVYRTYVRHPDGTVTEADTRYVTQAVDQARERRPELDAELFDFLRGLLLLRISGDREAELATRFQQLTGPAMAKGVEDTAFYRFHRLIALNEVGGDPACFGVSVEHFHDACAQALTRHPQSLLATSTHDTKRSEDVRARLLLLSEMPDKWTAAVHHWMERNAVYRSDGLPDPTTEYLLYQTLVGAWPIDAQRMGDYMEKAVREAKLHTSWTQPNEAYEAAVRDFVNAVLEDEGFLADLEDFVKPLVTPGRINGLSQTLLKLTTPGVPDIYQGAELWDLSLVDPDNRRPVDFTVRERLLAELEGLSTAEILARSDEGLPKLWVICQALRLRRDHPDWLGPEGQYRPLHLTGGKATHGVAFLRGEGVAVLVPRLVHALGGDWGDAMLHLPTGHWRNVLTEEAVDGGEVSVAHLLVRFPVALLVREEDRP
jgi:(1->4)-alpha-D-glucan 1-alpha-D-glucosylmutase